jgi:hypothetical protein
MGFKGLVPQGDHGIAPPCQPMKILNFVLISIVVSLV